MKARSFYFVPLLIIIILTGCAPYQPRSFLSDKLIDNRIPALEVGKIPVDFKYSEGTFKMFRVTCYEEWSDFIRQEFWNRVCEPDTVEKHGYLTWKIDSKIKVNWGWSLISFLSLFSINCIGVPVSSQTADVTLEVTIYDTNRLPVTEYSARAKSTAYAAMWWGYSGVGAVTRNDGVVIMRASNLKAISKALDEIILKIQDDSKTIRNKLLDTAEINKRKHDYINENQEDFAKLKSFKIGVTNFDDVLFYDWEKCGNIRILEFNAEYKEYNQKFRVIRYYKKDQEGMEYWYGCGGDSLIYEYKGSYKGKEDYYLFCKRKGKTHHILYQNQIRKQDCSVK